MVMIVGVLVVAGLCLGSFVNALVWRLYEQLNHGGRKVDGLSILHGRSMCPRCRHKLAAKDLVPVFSWLSLGGKCRYCRRPIGAQYPIVEVLTAALFVASYAYWPVALHGVGLFEFVLWLIFLTGLIALVVYDARWFVLPNRIVYPLTILALLQTVAITVFYHGGLSNLFSAGWGAVLIGGLFFALFQISKGRWIGGGDVKLGLLLGLLVGGPLPAILVLFLSSSGGSLIAIPLLVSGKAKRNSRLPFGPFLIAAAIVVRLFGAAIISWYQARYALH